MTRETIEPIDRPEPAGAGYSVRKAARFPKALTRIAIDDGGHAALLVRDDNNLRALSFEGVANLALVQKQPKCAARLLGAAETLRETEAHPAPPANRKDYDSSLARLRDLLGEEVFAAEWDTGRALNEETAMQEALAFLAGNS